MSTVEKVAEVYKFLGVIFIDDAEKPGIMIDLKRLSDIKRGSYNLEFSEISRANGQNMHLLGAFMRSIESDKPWTTNEYRSAHPKPNN